MNIQNKVYYNKTKLSELHNKYFLEIKNEKNFFINYNDDYKNDYENFLIAIECAYYVLDNTEKKETDQKEKNIVKKRITFTRNNNDKKVKNNSSIDKINNNKKAKNDSIIDKIEIENHENNKIEIDQSKIEHVVKKYNKFIDMILFIIEKNAEILNKKNICLMELFNKYDKEKYFKMLCTKDKDYLYWKQYGLEPPIVHLSKILDGKINIVNKNPHTIYFEKIK